MSFRNNPRKKRSQIWQLDKDELATVVKQSDSFHAILVAFQIPNRGGTYKVLKRRLQQDNIDYSHINEGRSSNRGRKFTGKGVPLESIMTENSAYPRGSLKKRLLSIGLISNVCACCGLTGEWNGRPIVMILDHINGVANDHRLENLRMVCPNCNSQLDTFAGRNSVHK